MPRARDPARTLNNDDRRTRAKSARCTLLLLHRLWAPNPAAETSRQNDSRRSRAPPRLPSRRHDGLAGGLAARLRRAGEAPRLLLRPAGAIDEGLGSRVRIRLRDARRHREGARTRPARRGPPPHRSVPTLARRRSALVPRSPSPRRRARGRAPSSPLSSRPRTRRSASSASHPHRIVVESSRRRDASSGTERHRSPAPSFVPPLTPARSFPFRPVSRLSLGVPPYPHRSSTSPPSTRGRFLGRVRPAPSTTPRRASARSPRRSTPPRRRPPSTRPSGASRNPTSGRRSTSATATCWRARRTSRARARTRSRPPSGTSP